jgi:hypothetical protein
VGDLTGEQLAFLSSDRGREALGRDLPGDPMRAITLLRKTLSASEASAVVKLQGIRSRCSRLGPIAPDLLATETLAAQASSWPIARLKARLLREAGVRSLWDLCCGIGIDALAFAAEGLDVRAVDRDDRALLCLEHNAESLGLAGRIEPLEADVESLELGASEVVHVDPDRRATGRRTADVTQYSPDLWWLSRLVERSAGGLMKLSPGADEADLPSLGDVRLRYVSEAGVCKQLVGTWGDVWPGPDRLAVVVEEAGREVVRHDLPAGCAPVRPVRPDGRFVLDPDPAVLAAGALDDLAAELGAWRGWPGLGLLLGDKAPETPFGRWHEILSRCPGRRGEVRRALKQQGAGIVEVKPRGLKLDTDALQAALRGSGGRMLSVFWLRVDEAQKALICRRVRPSV